MWRENESFGGGVSGVEGFVGGGVGIRDAVMVVVVIVAVVVMVMGPRVCMEFMLRWILWYMWWWQDKHKTLRKLLIQIWLFI